MKISIKDRVNKLKELIKKVLEKYPATMVIIYVCTAIIAIFLDSPILEADWMIRMLTFLGIWAFGTFFTENLNNKTYKMIAYVVTAVISAIYVYADSVLESKELLEKIFICYIATLNASSLFLIIKKSGKDFSEYLLKVSINFLKTSFIYGILALGIALVLWIFNALILNVGSKYISNIEIFLLGFFYTSKMIYSLIDIEEDVSKFFKNLVKYVLMPLVISAFTIIYLYILKIIILREIPKNQIYRIALGLFIIGGFVWTVMQYFKDEGVIYKISLKLPYIFSPFILLQCYAIGVRIVNNGLTPARYICVIFIIFEICYIMMYIFKKEKIQNLIILADILLIISVLIPGINMEDLAYRSQTNNLNILLEKNNLTDKEKEKVLGAYNYLRRTDEGKKYINENFTDDAIGKIKELDNSKYGNYNNYEYIYLSNSREDININGYNKLKFISSSYNGNEVDFDKLLQNVEFKCNNDKIKVDVRDGVRNYIKDKNNKYIEIQIDDNKKLVIYYLSIRYDEIGDKVAYYNFDGYLLEK